MGLLVAFPQSSAGQVKTVPDWHPGRDQGLQVGHPPAPPFEPVALQTVNEAQRPVAFGAVGVVGEWAQATLQRIGPLVGQPQGVDSGVATSDAKVWARFAFG